MQKLLTFFSAKNISTYAIFNDPSFNDTLTKDIVSFEQLGPVCVLVHPSEKRSTPRGEQILSFKGRPFFIREANNMDGVSFPEIISISLTHFSHPFPFLMTDAFLLSTAYAFLEKENYIINIFGGKKVALSRPIITIIIIIIIIIVIIDTYDFLPYLF